MAEQNEALPHMDKDGIMTYPDGRRFKINDAGEIVALDGKDIPVKSETEAAKDAEYGNLDYLINNHPDRLNDVDAARAQRASMQEKMGIDSKKSAAAFAKAREKLRARIIQKNNPGLMDIISKQRQND